MDETVVMQIVADQLHISADSLREETSFVDISADSLDVFQIISALEETYNIEFDNDVAENMKTIGNVLDYIRKVVEK
ncbi:acyl carrier protein [Anaerotignum sp.]|uniref:acyl carrier protein n=1 Tax=Anaerotignum sp. TaxID=2039241 RepID=UPI002A9208EB|nr:acyl carrier protein [Anaerotignum sp.]MCI7656834.1 acyl carrier protein [Clostridia bacterium]MDY5414995.1 acyl carrier protein [Anaerotignum sp.]